MEGKIPLPTDNLYKFAALFSLLLLIFSMGGVIYLSERPNSLLFEHWVERQVLEGESQLPVDKQARKEALERQISIAVKDRDSGVTMCSFIGAFAFFGMLLGFGAWYRKTQAISDETARIQLEISKLEFERLRAEVSSVVTP